MPKVYKAVCELLTDFKNTFYEFGTLLHCFNDYSLDYHTVSSKCPLWPIRRRQDALSISCAINCTAVPYIQQ